MKKIIGAVALVGLMVSGGLASGSAHAAQLVPQNPQQALVQAFDALPPQLQQEVVVAYRKAPIQVRQTLTYLESLGADVVIGDFQLMEDVWSELPAQYQQEFVDGVLGVSPQEDAFAYEIINRYYIDEPLCGTAAADGVTLPGC
jgi:hypothetical protein